MSLVRCVGPNNVNRLSIKTIRSRVLSTMGVQIHVADVSNGQLKGV